MLADPWRGSLRHRLVYGVAVALFMVAAVSPVSLLREEIFGEEWESFANETKRFLPFIAIGSFIAGFAAWYPTSRHEPMIDNIRLVATMVGLAFWIPGLMLPIASHSSSWSGTAFGHIFMALVGSVAGGFLGAALFGHLAYLFGTLVLAPLRHLERSKFPTSSAGFGRTGLLPRVVNTIVAMIALLSAGIALLSTLVELGGHAIDGGRVFSSLL